MSHKARMRKPPSQRGDRPARPDPARAVNPNDPAFIARHEAGHAVAAVVLGLPLNGVDLVRRVLPNGQTSVGFTDCPARFKPEDGEDVAVKWMAQGLAGPFAEGVINPGLGDAGEIDADRAAVNTIAALATCRTSDLGGGRQGITPAEMGRNQGRIKALMDRAIERACDVVNRHSHAIDVAANALMKLRKLSADDVAAIVREYPPTPSGEIAVGAG